MSEEATTNPQDQDISCNILLSVAKDERYVEECRRQVQKILEWLLYPSFSRSSLSSQTTTSWIISAALFALASATNRQQNRRKTPGMEVSGLTSISTANSTSFWLVVLAATSIYLFATRRFNPSLVSEGNNDSTITDDRDLQLRGNQRRQAFQRQRQQMIQFAHRQQQHLHQYGQPQEDMIHGQRHAADHRTISFRSKLQRVISRAIQSIVTALSSCRASGGPHDLPWNSNHFGSLGVWLLRLRLAYYCLGGRQSLFGGTMVPANKEEAAPAANGSAIYDSPEPRAVRLLGLLILSHAAGRALQMVSLSFLRWSIVAFGRDNDESMLRTRHRGSVPDTSEEEKDHHPNNGRNRSVVLCTICQEPRTHPSCSVNCGHVFCWNCLQLWVANKAECPVCRRSCRPQDILPLQNYYDSFPDHRTVGSPP